MVEFESQITVNEIVNEFGTKLELLEMKCEEEKLLTLAEYCDPISVVGHALGLTKAQVSAIENDYRTTKEKRLALLQTWKESFAFRATYKKFIEALVASGKAEQATKVCKLLAQRETKDEVATANSSINPSLDTVCSKLTEHDTQYDGLNASTSEVIETQEDIFLPSLPSNPPSSDPPLAEQHEADSNLEYSDSSSSSDERSVLEAKIYSLEEEYRIIGEKITDILKRGSVTLDNLQTYAANLPHRVRRCYEELRENRLVDKATSAKSIDSFVGVLNDYSNFLNPTLLADAVKKFGDKATKSQMRAYNKKVGEFQESTTLVQFVTKCSWKGVTPKGYEEIELVLETDWEEKTLKDIAPPKLSWLLKKVYYGSLRVVFSIANIEDLEEEDVREYLQIHVKRVNMNGTCVLNFESDEAISGQTVPAVTETVQLTDIPSDFRFSSVSHGKDIVLSEDGLEACRGDAVYTGVYVATPLQGTCEFEVKVTDCDSSSDGSLEIGVSQRPTGTYKHLDIPYHVRKDSCIWLGDSVRNGLSGDVIKTKYGSMNLRYLKTSDKVAVRLSENGDLHFFLNGVDQGLASRNVYREGWDTYLVIDVQGSCKAVKITRAVMPEYVVGLKGQQSSDNISPHNIQFGFHPVTGRNIRLFEDGLYARRVNSSYLGGVVYSAMPIKHHGTFEVVITEHEHDNAYSIQIGVMRQTITKTELEQSDVPEFSLSANNHFVWSNDRAYNNLSSHYHDLISAYGRVNLVDLREGDKVGLRLSSDGTLSFFVNGNYQGVAVRGLLQEGYNIYAMVDVRFNCHAVRITRAETRSEYEVPDLQELCVEKIASCLDSGSSKDVNLLPLPQGLKNQIEQYINYL